jgi:probable HAF family extracellular repeat protein
MKRLLGLTLAATCAFYTFAPAEGNAADAGPSRSISYTADFVSDEILPVGINRRGEIAAGGSLGGRTAVVFIDRRGETTTFQCPFTDPIRRSTGADEINNRGDIVGTCFISANIEPGFFRSSNDFFFFVRAPGAAATYPRGINDVGQIVGEILKEGPGSVIVRFGSFLFSEGQFTDFGIESSHPDDVNIPNPIVITSAQSINNQGQIVGSYRTVNTVTTQSGPTRAFLFDDGQVTTIEVPGALSTRATAINNRGEILLQA